MIEAKPFPSSGNGRVSWSVDVPLLGNRLMWREVMSVYTAAWLGMCLLVGLGFWLAMRHNPEQARGSLLLGLLIMSAAFWGVFLLAALLFFCIKGRQRFHFRIDQQQAASLVIKSQGERILAGAVGIMAGLSGNQGMAAAAGQEASEDSIRRRAAWRHLRKIKFHPDLLAISLYRWPWPGLPLVLYLPHQTGYQKVRERLPRLCPQLRLP